MKYYLGMFLLTLLLSVTVYSSNVSTGGGGGATTIDALTDTNITSLSDNQILKYDSGTAKWLNEADLGTVISGLTDTVMCRANGTDNVEDSTITVADTSSNLENTYTGGGWTINQADETTADASAAPNFVIQASNKTAGTGDGGDLQLYSGASSGGSGGNVELYSNDSYFVLDDITDEPYEFWIDGSDYLNLGPVDVEADSRVYITVPGTPSAGSSIELQLNNQKGTTLRHTILTGDSNVPATRSSGNYYIYSSGAEWKMYGTNQIETNASIWVDDDTYKMGKTNGGALARWTEAHWGTGGVYIGEDTSETGNLYLGATGSLLTSDASGNVSLNPDGTNDAITADAAENVTVGAGGLAQAATDGFAYIPTVADAPSGTPTAKTGFVPIAWDTTNNDLCVYDGSWQCISFD